VIIPTQITIMYQNASKKIGRYKKFYVFLGIFLDLQIGIYFVFKSRMNNNVALSSMWKSSP